MRELINSTALSAICVLSVMALAAPAQAAGFYLQESSISALGSAFSGSTTTINDASTVYFNPSGMTRMKDPILTGGVHVLRPDSDLTNTGTTFGGAPVTGGESGSPYDTEAVPNLFAVIPVKEDLWFGLGVNAPFGLANEYDEGWFGRYDSTSSELKTINVSPVLAYKMNDKLSIGGGVDIQYADADLRTAVFDGAEGESKLAGDDISVGYNFGLTYTPVEGTVIGAHYRSDIEHKLDGRVSLTGSATSDFDFPGTVELHLPSIATFGVAQDVGEKWTVTGQVTWFEWSNFEAITTVLDNGSVLSSVAQNYDDTFAYALGVEYDYSDALTLRAGYQFDETPTVDGFRTSRTPDGDRNWFAVGATYETTDKISVDLAAVYIDISEENIDLVRNGGLSDISATSEGSVGILSFGVNYKF